MKIDTPWLSQYENIKASYDYPDISLVDFLEETVKNTLHILLIIILIGKLL